MSEDRSQVVRHGSALRWLIVAACAVLCSGCGTAYHRSPWFPRDNQWSQSSRSHNGQLLVIDSTAERSIRSRQRQQRSQATDKPAVAYNVTRWEPLHEQPAPTIQQPHRLAEVELASHDGPELKKEPRKPAPSRRELLLQRARLMMAQKTAAAQRAAPQ